MKGLRRKSGESFQCDEIAAGGLLMRGNWGILQTPLSCMNGITSRRLEVSQRRSDQMADYRVNPGEVEEDQFTAAIEKSTSKIPTSAYLALALGAMAVSAALQAWNKKHESMFVGQWAAPFLLLGIYNKLVKQHGSDGRSRGRDAGYIGSGESHHVPAETYTHSASL
jgi:hypothetical protein